VCVVLCVWCCVCGVVCVYVCVVLCVCMCVCGVCVSVPSNFKIIIRNVQLPTKVENFFNA